MKGYDAQEVIERIASVAESVGRQAGVGGMETAGAIISYLADHPRDLEPFMNGGYFELPGLMHQYGRLTWHGANGKIIRPDFARRARTIADMKNGAPQ